MAKSNETLIISSTWLAGNPELKQQKKEEILAATPFIRELRSRLDAVQKSKYRSLVSMDRFESASSQGKAENLLGALSVIDEILNLIPKENI